MPNAKFFIDPTLAGAAGPYYTLFPVEPTPSATSSDWLKPDGKLAFPKSQNLDEWLTAIAAGASAGGNIVLVCHGNTRGLKLYIGDKGQDVHLEREAADAIRRNQEGNGERREHGADPEDEARCLRQAEGADREGAGPGSQSGRCARLQHRPGRRVMSAMQQFFNCSTFCCPKMLDSFGPIIYGKFVTDPATFDKWVKDHPGADVSGTAGDRFGFFQNLSKGVASEAMAESAKGVKAWADSKMPAGGNFTGNNQLFYHALTDLKTFVFAGEPAFRAQLVEATKGNVPSRKIDINAPLTLP